LEFVSNPEEAAEAAARFDAQIDAAVEAKYAVWPLEHRNVFLPFLPVRTWRVAQFHEALVSGGVFPAERAHLSVQHMCDVKIQLYFLSEVDLGLYNRLIHDLGFDPKDPGKTPHLFLTHLSLDQTVIGKSRVLWERIMNFVFHLATGEVLEQKVSKKRSKRRVFSERILSDPNWSFLTPCMEALHAFEESLRSPEYHKGSPLRAALMANRLPDGGKVLQPLNLALNVWWENLLAIVRGDRPYIFYELPATSS
jgi:hypothetical protein